MHGYVLVSFRPFLGYLRVSLGIFRYLLVSFWPFLEYLLVSFGIFRYLLVSFGIFRYLLLVFWYFRVSFGIFRVSFGILLIFPENVLIFFGIFSWRSNPPKKICGHQKTAISLIWSSVSESRYWFVLIFFFFCLFSWRSVPTKKQSMDQNNPFDSMCKCALCLEHARLPKIHLFYVLKWKLTK